MGKTVKDILAKAKAEKAGGKALSSPSKAKGGKKEKDKDKEVNSTQVSVQKEKSAALQKFTPLLCVSMANRLRAVESMVMWCYILPSDTDFMDALQEIGKQHHKAIMAAKNGGGEYQPECPVHIIAWIAVLHCIQDSLTDTPLDKYLDEVESNDYHEAKKRCSLLPPPQML